MCGDALVFIVSGAGYAWMQLVASGSGAPYCVLMLRLEGSAVGSSPSGSGLLYLCSSILCFAISTLLNFPLPIVVPIGVLPSYAAHSTSYSRSTYFPCDAKHLVLFLNKSFYSTAPFARASYSLLKVLLDLTNLDYHLKSNHFETRRPMAGVKRALSSGGTQASSKGKRSKKDKKEPRTENASSEHSAAAPEKRGRPRKGLKHAAASKVKVANDGSASRAVSSMGEVASSSSRGISSSNPAETAAVQRPQQRQASEQSSRTQREDLMLFLDLGNSQTQVAYYWRGKQLLWFDDWAGEAKTTQVPTMVTAYKKPNGEWTRTFGLHARTDSHLIEGAVVFDRLKMNFDPDSKYLDDQKKKEGETGYCDNWNFLLESYLTTVLDGIVDSNHPPKRVYTYMGPPAKWDAAVIAKYTASVVPPRKWAGKFEMIVRVLNEASAAFLGRVNNGLTLKNGRRGIVIDPGHGTTVRVHDTFANRLR